VSHESFFSNNNNKALILLGYEVFTHQHHNFSKNGYDPIVTPWITATKSAGVQAENNIE
jgi:hypothetical protein